MIVGGAIVLWAIAVALTCAMCVAAGRADASEPLGEDMKRPEPEPVRAAPPVQPQLTA